MKYKIIALSVASFLGISSIVLSNSSNNSNQYIVGNEKFTYNIDFTNNTDTYDNTFTKGDMIALSQGANNKKANDDELEEDDE